MTGEPQALPDDWPLTPLERLELEWRALAALYQELRADTDQLVARVTELERQRTRENED